MFIHAPLAVAMIVLMAMGASFIWSDLCGNRQIAGKSPGQEESLA
jgi:hypothetical protein